MQTPCGHELDASGSPTVEQYASHVRVRSDPKVPAMSDRVQEGVCRATALPVDLRHLVRAHPELESAVEIPVEGQANLLARLDEGSGKSVRMNLVGHPQKAVLPVKFIPQHGIVLKPLVGFQYRVGIPAIVPKTQPGLIVGGLTAHVGHRVDRAPPAQPSSLREIDMPPVQTTLRKGLVLPPQL